MQTLFTALPATKLRALAPGLLLTITIAAAATFISEHYGAPVMLMALLIGMAFHFQSQDERSAAGIDFAAKTLLRAGVALLGARITIDQIESLGVVPIVIVIVSVVTTILFGTLAAKFMGRTPLFGLLTAGAVSICGASAALAIASALPRGAAREQDTLFTVIAVTTLSTVAMIIYPVVFAALGFSEPESGFLLGATIHDVAQVVGAGYAVSDTAGDIATYTKLLRVSLLPAVIFAISLAFIKAAPGAGRNTIPWFVIAFAFIVVLNSVGAIPEIAVGAMKEMSRWLLVCAISALGMKTSLEALSKVGGRTIILVVAETLFLAGLTIGGVIIWMR